jgi:hypothetical protein
MAEKKKSKRTLTNDQIRVTKKFHSATDVLLSAKPYLDAALKAIPVSGAKSSRPIEVPPEIVRDLVVMLIAEIKRADELFANGAQPRGDRGDSDLNPFNGIDFEFDLHVR